ncbi:hypothetical protein Cni_G16459 [Canna indica]|uniref:Uncharacterized protein n=1 Tax=Canna indica TaxID=4628 RepID=A0AAQ3KKX4_9LILI|nr:hypothetical protein Cni_G16459 [Canna indica]
MDATVAAAATATTALHRYLLSSLKQWLYDGVMEFDMVIRHSHLNSMTLLDSSSSQFLHINHPIFEFSFHNNSIPQHLWSRLERSPSQRVILSFSAKYHCRSNSDLRQYHFHCSFAPAGSGYRPLQRNRARRAPSSMFTWSRMLAARIRPPLPSGGSLVGLPSMSCLLVSCVVLVINVGHNGPSLRGRHVLPQKQHRGDKASLGSVEDDSEIRMRFDVPRPLKEEVRVLVEEVFGIKRLWVCRTILFTLRLVSSDKGKPSLLVVASVDPSHLLKEKMDESLVSDSVKKRLHMQNEVLKWLVEFSDKLHHRAKDIAMEVNGLLDQAGVVELDLKNTTNTLWNLSRNLVIDHKISDKDGTAHPIKDHVEGSAQASIPAQDYEKDILPRYKSALSLGLASCKKHLHGTGRNHTSSIFRKTASAYSLLPHIIGSEEFIHDNSCGITENLSVRNPLLDFGLIVESKQASSTAEEPPNLFGPDLFGIQGGSSGKVMADPLASAATDFKAMLEAALLNPYKFYDDETLPVHDVRATKLETGETNKDVVGSSGEHEAVGHGTYEQLNNTAEEEKLVAGGNVLPDTHAHDFYSALVGGSLFDIEEDLLSFEQKDPAEVSSNVAESSSSHFGIKDTDELPNDTHSSSINTAFCDSYEYLIAHVEEDNLVCNNEEESGERSSEEVNFEKNDRQKPSYSEDSGSSSLYAICDEILPVMESCKTDCDLFEKGESKKSSQ